jgi:hypothetical protein
VLVALLSVVGARFSGSGLEEASRRLLRSESCRSESCYGGTLKDMGEVGVHGLRPLGRRVIAARHRATNFRNPVHSLYSMEGRTWGVRGTRLSAHTLAGAANRRRLPERSAQVAQHRQFIPFASGPNDYISPRTAGV